MYDTNLTTLHLSSKPNPNAINQSSELRYSSSPLCRVNPRASTLSACKQRREVSCLTTPQPQARIVVQRSLYSGSMCQTAVMAPYNSKRRPGLLHIFPKSILLSSIPGMYYQGIYRLFHSVRCRLIVFTAGNLQVLSHLLYTKYYYIASAFVERRVLLQVFQAEQGWN